MRKSSIYKLSEGTENILDGILPVGKFKEGGLHFFKPNEVSHADEVRHVHEGHYEVFINVQGKGVVEVEGENHSFELGDVILIEPGESHHVKTDPQNPLVNLWMGAEIKQ